MVLTKTETVTEKTDEMEKLRSPLSTLELYLRLVSSIEDYGSRTWVDSWRSGGMAG